MELTSEQLVLLLSPSESLVVLLCRYIVIEDVNDYIYEVEFPRQLQAYRCSGVGVCWKLNKEKGKTV